MFDFLDPAVGGAGLFVGFVVGMTGMGGGALMTPILVLFFGIQPLAAVSSDLVASMLMKPLGGAVHMKQGTVNRQLNREACGNAARRFRLAVSAGSRHPCGEAARARPGLTG